MSVPRFHPEQSGRLRHPAESDPKRTERFLPGLPGCTARWRRAPQGLKPKTTSWSGDLGDFVRPDAPCAGIDSTVAAANPGAYALQVRLESAGPYVMRVAELPADDRGLSTNFATIRHVGFSPSADLLRAVLSRPETSKYNKQLEFLALGNRIDSKGVQGPQRNDDLGTSTARGERMTSSFPQSSGPGQLS